MLEVLKNELEKLSQIEFNQRWSEVEELGLTGPQAEDYITFIRKEK